MLLLTILVLILFAFFNYRIGGRALLYPPVVFCGIWALDSFLLWVSQGSFYGVLPETLLFFLCGALMFSIGCWAAMLVPERKTPKAAVVHQASNRIITILLTVVIAGAPFYWRWLSSLAATRTGPVAFLAIVRVRTIELAGKSTALTVFGTLLDLANIVALLAFWESKRHPKRAALAVILALVMGVLIGQKDGPLSLCVALIAVDWIKSRRLRWKVVGVMTLVMLTAASVLFFFVSVGSGSIQEKAGPILQQFAVYASGGLVGFDRVVREPNIVPHPNPLYVYYLRIMRRMGAHVDVPEVWGFISVGPHSVTDNSYTMYFSYLDGGYLGAIMTAGLIGLLTTLIYKHALQGRPVAVMLYGFLLRCVVFSPFTEYFFSTMYFMLKIWAIVWLVYFSPVRWAQFKSLMARTVEAELVKGQ